MKTRFLFPYGWRKIGFVLLLLGITTLVLRHCFWGSTLSWTEKKSPIWPLNYDDIINDVILLLVMTGPFIIAFTKEKIEDEQIAQLRLDSLQWAMYFNYAVVAAAIIITADLTSFLFIILYAMFSPLIFFIIRFRWVIYQSNRSLKNELQQYEK